MNMDTGKWKQIFLGCGGERRKEGEERNVTKLAIP